jgi:CRISPR-associated protein Cas1
MGYHILHVFQHGAMLGKERGFITCKGSDGQERRLPHEDLRAVIIAARGVSMSSNFVAGVIEEDGIILHCNESYQPCGITAPLQRVIDSRAFIHQCERPVRLNEKLWNKMLRGKTLNQTKVLDRWDLKSAHLDRALTSREIDEGNCAKRYWQLYFPSIGWSATRRDRKENTAPNQMLNYGYTVLAALCHRSLLVHGLLPALGVHHTTRYQSDPLVYDLMEPFRPIVDCLLAEFMREEDVSMKAWCKKIGNELRERRVQHERFSLKLLDAVDASASSLTRSYAEQDAGLFWAPVLEAA